MEQRKSGWYRVKIDGNYDFDIAYYFKENDTWEVVMESFQVDAKRISCVDPKMVMTPEGELVYHSAEHDPIFNTQQER